MVEDLAKRKRAKQAATLIMRIKSRVGSHMPTKTQVTLINVLLLPHGYVYVDEHGLVNLVVINGPKLIRPTSLSLMHYADVYWHFQPATGEWNVIKDRTGSLDALCPIKFGGIPAVKAVNR